MRIVMFSAKPYDRASFEAANTTRSEDPRGRTHDLEYVDTRLTPRTAALAGGAPVVCAFVNDDLGAATLERLAAEGTRLLALRSAGFNHVDLRAAADLDLTVVRVPAYSPHAVAEHAVGLILTLDRRIHRAYNRVREGNFALEGLLGRDLHGQTVGVVGTGTIGTVFARIMAGFGVRLLASDPVPNDEVRALGADYVALEDLFRRADIVSLHAPLTPATHHLIDAAAIELLRDDVMLVNTSRGGLIDTTAVIDALKVGRIGSLALDVYEEEEGLFFEDLSDRIIRDDVFSRLLTFPNVLITGHQAFFTREALAQIAETTLANVTAFERADPTGYHEVTVERLRG